VIRLHHGDNLPVLKSMPAASVDLVYIDPPFNTGKAQERKTTAATRDATADRVGFGGERYRVEERFRVAYQDAFHDYLGFLGPRLEELARVLKPTGSLFVHLDPREVHYVKVFLDGLLGRDHFMNEIIWAYDYGGRSRSRWSAKHDDILWYAMDPASYTYNFDEIDRIPYMAPELVGAEKAERGKTPTDAWWHTIVSPTGKEKTGYPTQKPVGILDRIVRVHSHPGDTLLDCFAGSGSFGEAAARLGRDAILVDEHPAAIEIMRRRLSPYGLDVAAG
jgi:site-specific DNA-methyltransferase (adenine-specific)